MDDNVWEYPFGELDDDDDLFFDGSDEAISKAKLGVFLASKTD